MKELTEQEILAVAGGLPPSAVLDEISYRAPAEPLRDPMAHSVQATDERPDSRDE